MATITIEITGERLAAMDSNDMMVYATPGAHEVYWSSHPNFQDDRGVASVQDFLDEAGYDELDETLFGEIFTLDVQLIEAR